MINTILIPLAIGLLFAEFSGIPQSFARWLASIGIGKANHNGFTFTKKLPYKLKPFGCGLCLTFWIALFLNVYSCNFTFIESVGFACMSSCIAYLIITIRDRINR